MSELKKPIIIYDTDMDTDCDDTGALVMLLNAAKKGEIELRGIIVDAPVKEGAPCCECFCQYYGVDVPIGTVYEDEYLSTPRFARYAKHRPILKPTQYYNKTLAARVGKMDTDYPEAATLYRKLLAEAEDNSLTITCVGFMTSFAKLLASQGDEISPLSGVELVKKKVNRVVSMGELPENGDKCVSFNYVMDLVGTEGAFENCPIDISVSPVGTHVITGAHLTDSLPEGHPLRTAYEEYNGIRTGRSSWDLIAVLQAMKPDNPYQHLEPIGMVRANAAQQRMWCDENGSRHDTLVVSNITDEEMAAVLNEMLK